MWFIKSKCINNFFCPLCMNYSHRQYLNNIQRMFLDLVSRYKLSLFSMLLIFILSFFMGCGQEEKLEKIDFEDTIELKEKEFSQKTEINICVGSMITPEEGHAYYKKLLDYIGQKLDMKVNFVEKRTYAEVNGLLKNGGVDVAFVCGGPYVIGHDEFGLELLAAPLVDGEAVYYSYIIVSKKSGIKKFEELRGKTFAFVDPMSNTGRLIPTYMLYELGEEPQSFFKKCSYTYSHDNSIKAVAQGMVDGAAVDSLIWDYMDKKDRKFTKETEIIKISKPYGIPPLVVRPGLDEGLKIRIKDILLNMHNEKEGSDILKGMFIDRFIEVDDSIYDTIRKVRVHIAE